MRRSGLALESPSSIDLFHQTHFDWGEKAFDSGKSGTCGRFASHTPMAISKSIASPSQGANLRPRPLPIQGKLCPDLRLRRRPGRREGSWRSFPFGVGTSVFRIAHERFSSAVSLCFHCGSMNFGGLPFGDEKERRERQRACSKRRSIGQKETYSVWKLSGGNLKGEWFFGMH